MTFEHNNNLDLILLNVGFVEPNDNWNWKDVHSPFARIYYVKSGEAKTKIDGNTYTLKPNHLYLTPPFTLHDDVSYGPFSLYYVHFYEKTINKESIFDKYIFPIGIEALSLDLLLIERLLEINPDRHLRNLDPQLYDNFPTFSRYVAESNKMAIHSSIETQGILYQFLSRFAEHMETKSSNKDDRINKCLEHIHVNPDKEISVKELADLACISENHLIRLFKKEVKSTPLKYINSKKIEKAQLLLLTTNMPIREVALELSLDNVSYFNRIFKEYTGKTPSDYKKQFQQ